MRKNIFIASFTALIVAGFFLLPFILGSLFVSDGYFKTVNSVYQIFGYELRCSDLHGNNRCRLIQSDKALEQSSFDREERYTKNYGCDKDEDCFVTADHKCITGSVLAGQLNAKHQKGAASSYLCACRKGPVTYGCVNKGSGL